ncbi:methyltransferase domain-containing protein [Paenibacillus sp. FSL M7-0802]|uniref:methyltransferase domain-containing protein n=1 Tax=Paenibacillus TaxID=44249 RepID=UPI0003D340F6|nr:methyltransferase domain-containing protein [Paenibacillus polymyxa]AIW41948.1 hypothetical protein X809_39525 [Paenibacillus polymyxa CR1]
MQKTSVILNAAPYDQDYLAASIDNIRKFTERGTYELIVVEHGGSFKIKEWLADQTDIITLFHDSLLTEGQAWNRGIEIASGNSVLLLHSDTLVTEYWLDYMIPSLYQNDDIAGVGPMSNHAAGDQALEVTYDSKEGMLQFGRNCNRSFGLKQQLTLAGFCLFLKKDVISSIGPFHEQLQGHELTVDYCLRIAQANYRLMVCTNVFVHHYRVEKNSEPHSSRTFKAKWGISAQEVQSIPEFRAVLPVDVSGVVRILVVECGYGGTLLSLYHSLPEAEIHGVELNSTAREISQGMFPDSITISSTLQDYKSEQESFDYIFLNTTCNIQETLEHCHRLLKPSGGLLVNLPNVYHYSTIASLMNGVELGQHQLTDWSVDSLTVLLDSAGFEISTTEVVKDQTPPEEQAFINGLKRISSGELSKHIEVRRFLISAKKAPDSAILHERFNRLFQSPDEELVEEILQSSSSTILKAINTYDGPIVPLLNYLAISYYERNGMKQVFPLLSRAHELAPEDPTTLLNLGTVYYGAGDDEKALYWLERIQEKNEQIKGWIEELQEIVSLKADRHKWLKFLILRVEHNVQRSEALQEITKLFTSTITIEEVGDVIQNNVFDKSNTTAIFVNYFFEQGHYEATIHLLNLSLLFNEDKDYTNYLIASLYYTLGDWEKSLNALGNVEQENEQVRNLRDKITTLKQE